MKFKLILSFSLLINLNCINAQTTIISYRNGEDFKNFRKKRIEFSGSQITQLRQEGALIVLLHTEKNKIIGTISLEKQRFVAMTQKDTLFLQKILAEDLIYIHSMRLRPAQCHL